VSVAALLLPDFLLLLAGALLRRLTAFPPAFWAGLERLIYFLLFPALLFRSILRLPAVGDDLYRFAAVGVGFTLLGMALGWLGRALPHRSEREFAACYQCGFRFNTYVALAVASRLEGEWGVAALSFLIGILVPLVNLAAVSALAKSARLRIWSEILKNPLVLACLVAFLWRATGWSLPEVPRHLLDSMGGAALPLGLLAAGAGLVFERAVLPWQATVFWNALKLLVLPAAAWALGAVVGLHAAQLRLIVVMAAVPTATSAYVLASRMGAPTAPVALLISSGTLLAMLTLPLWLIMLG
jgi:predicted permease